MQPPYPPQYQQQPYLPHPHGVGPWQGPGGAWGGAEQELVAVTASHGAQWVGRVMTPGLGARPAAAPLPPAAAATAMPGSYHGNGGPQGPSAYGTHQPYPPPYGHPPYPSAPPQPSPYGGDYPSPYHPQHQPQPYGNEGAYWGGPHWQQQQPGWQGHAWVPQEGAGHGPGMEQQPLGDQPWEEEGEGEDAGEEGLGGAGAVPGGSNRARAMEVRAALLRGRRGQVEGRGGGLPGDVAAGAIEGQGVLHKSAEPLGLGQEAVGQGWGQVEQQAVGAHGVDGARSAPPLELTPSEVAKNANREAALRVLRRLRGGAGASLPPGGPQELLHDTSAGQPPAGAAPGLQQQQDQGQQGDQGQAGNKQPQVQAQGLTPQEADGVDPTQAADGTAHDIADDQALEQLPAAAAAALKRYRSELSQRPGRPAQQNLRATAASVASGGVATGPARTGPPGARGTQDGRPRGLLGGEDGEEPPPPACLLSPAAATTSVLFLGTGCAEPSKYRGASGVLIRGLGPPAVGGPGQRQGGGPGGAAAAAAAVEGASEGPGSGARQGRPYSVLVEGGGGPYGALVRWFGPKGAAARVGGWDSTMGGGKWHWVGRQDVMCTWPSRLLPSAGFSSHRIRLCAAVKPAVVLACVRVLAVRAPLESMGPSLHSCLVSSDILSPHWPLALSLALPSPLGGLPGPGVALPQAPRPRARPGPTAGGAGGAAAAASEA